MKLQWFLSSTSCQSFGEVSVRGRSGALRSLKTISRGTPQPVPGTPYPNANRSKSCPHTGLGGAWSTGARRAKEIRLAFLVRLLERGMWREGRECSTHFPQTPPNRSFPPLSSRGSVDLLRRQLRSCAAVEWCACCQAADSADSEMHLRSSKSCLTGAGSLSSKRPRSPPPPR